MKRIRDLILFAVIVSLGGLFLVSCGTSGGGGGSPYSVLGGLSLSNEGSGIEIVKNGKVDISDFDMPITGEVVSTAIVTLTNDTTGTSEVMPFLTSENAYVVPSSFSMKEGDRVSVRIEIDGDTITGDSTLIPNPSYSNLGPTVATLPFTASWEVSNTSFEASQTLFIIDEVDPGTEGHVAIMPISLTSIQITSAEVSAGYYGMLVLGVNPMNLSGAATGSIIYTTGVVPEPVLVVIN